MSFKPTPLDIEYQILLDDILTFGESEEDRTGVGTMSVFGSQLKTSLAGGLLPAITVRRVAPRIAFEELMFNLRGNTQTKILEDKGIKIWTGNTSKEFQEDRELGYLEEGDFGRMYGAQLREFNGVDPFTADPYKVDQLAYMVKEITTNRHSRRIISTHYNPAEAHLGVLFPCHIITQFNVRHGKLDCLFWMRSSDVGFGLPYNLMYYGMFCHIMAKLCGLATGDLVYQAGDTHLYNDQIESGMIDYMLEGGSGSLYSEDDLPVESPTFSIYKDILSMEDMLSLTWEDVAIHGYNPRSDFKNKPAMAI